jgi:hypothetical protein
LSRLGDASESLRSGRAALSACPSLATRSVGIGLGIIGGLIVAESLSQLAGAFVGC